MSESPVRTTPEEWGWYLYGIVFGGEELSGAETDELMTVEGRGLAAVVGKVPVAEYSGETLRELVRDATWLEAAICRHDRVVASLHERRSILPAKFGCVYASLSDLGRVLDETHDELESRLTRIAGCDEWGLHVYASSSTAEREILRTDPTIKDLLQKLRSASPGRAYFLERKLADALSSATEQWLTELAQSAHEKLSEHSVASTVEMTELHAVDLDPNRQIEILRSSYLVRRQERSTFLGEVDKLSATARFEYSGPWPPYSFAGREEPFS
jgi:hypothetical protein